MTNPVFADFVNQGLAESKPDSEESHWNWLKYGVPATAVSAATSIYNGVDFAAVKLASVFDEDIPSAAVETVDILGKLPVNNQEELTNYYTKHQDSIDLWGAIAGTLVPGTVATKGLHGVQALAAGRLVTPTSGLATGLLSNTAQLNYVAKAAEAIKAGTSTTTLRWKAAAAGGTQFAMEGVAFELGAFAALNQSTLYKDINDWKDFANHTASSALIFGVAGGLIKFGTFGAKQFIDSSFGPTTLNKLRDTVGESMTNAAFIKQSAAGLAGTKAAKQAAFTSGDELADLIRAQAPTVQKTGDAVLDARLDVINKSAGKELQNRKTQLITELTDQGLNANEILAQVNKLAVDAGMAIFTGAEKILKPTLALVADAKTYFANLVTGDISSKAILLAGDLGKVEYKGGFATLDGVSLNLGKEIAGGTAIATGELHKVNLAYYAADQAMAAAKAGGLIAPSPVQATSLAQVEAQFKHFQEIAIVDSAGKTLNFQGQGAIDAIKQLKTDAMRGLSNLGMSLDEIAARLNVKKDFLTTGNAAPDMFLGATDATKRTVVGIKYNTANAPDIFALKGAAALDTKIKAARETQQLIATNMLGESLPDLAMAELKALEHRFTGLVTASNAAYESILEKAQFIALKRQKFIEKLGTARAAEMVNSEQAVRKFGEGSAQAVELSAIANKIRSSEFKFVIDDTASGFVSQKWKRALATGSTAGLNQADHIITPKTPEVFNYFKSLVGMDVKYLKQQNTLRAAKGQAIIRGEGTIYIPPPPLSARKHAALVIDTNGAKGMLYAGTKGELDNLIAQAKLNHADIDRILTKEDTDIWFKAAGEYEAAQAYSASRMDTAMLRKGTLGGKISNNFQLIDDINAWFSRKEYAIGAGAVELNYGQQLAEAAMTAKALNPAGKSNAFTKIVDTMFGLSKGDEGSALKRWQIINEWFASAGDKVLELAWSDAARYLNKTKNPISLDEANKIAATYKNTAPGVNAFENQAMWDLAGARNWDGAARKAVNEANHGIRVAVLGLEYFNSVVNAISFPILALPEMRAAMKAGADVPYLKFAGDAIANYFKSPAKLLEYDAKGLVDKSLGAHRELIDAASLLSNAKTSSAVLQQAGIVQSKTSKFLAAMQTPTNWSERFTRFLAVDIGQQIAAARGLAGNQADAFAANFANKVAGNFTAGQRPQVFQGIIGQSVGLFQSYQFNYLQQAFRYLAEGPAKNAAMMMALQGTIFGAQSLPGFSVANYHLLEKHNEERAGVYSGLQTLVGREVGELVLYGTPSNLLGANLWSRGDVTPRNNTILPVTPEDIAVVNFFRKAGGALAEFGSSMLNGGNLAISGAELVAHSGVNRPLAGIAEWAMGARTSNNGKLDMPVPGFLSTSPEELDTARGVVRGMSMLTGDTLNMASMVRILGAKPMEEAIKMETFYRFKKIDAADQEKVNKIGAAMRTQILNQETGGDEVVLDDFARRYSDAGGSPENFRKFYLNNLKSATTPRAEAFANANRKSTWARNYQEQLQADEIPDLGASSSP